MINYSLIKNIDGWCSQEKMTKMVSLIMATKPKNVVEIGVFYGKSLICQALALKKNQSGKIYGIDSWDVADCLRHMIDVNSIEWWSQLNYEEIYLQCMKNIQDCGVEHFSHIFRGNSEMTLPYINFPIDILHIDGNHEEIPACENVLMYVPKIKQGGFLWFNDANWEQSKKAIDLVENKYKMVLIDKAKSDDPNNFCNLYLKI